MFLQLLSQKNIVYMCKVLCGYNDKEKKININLIFVGLNLIHYSWKIVLAICVNYVKTAVVKRFTIQ